MMRLDKIDVMTSGGAELAGFSTGDRPRAGVERPGVGFFQHKVPPLRRALLERGFGRNDSILSMVEEYTL